MARSEQVILWAIRAGRVDEAHDLFVKCNWIALDRSVIGDLRELPANVYTYANRLKQFPRYADLSEASLREKANQLLMFFTEMRQGDSVLYSSKLDQSLHCGRVVGDYVFIPNAPNGFAHRRPVEWIASVSRFQFSERALRQADRPPSLYKIENDAEEFWEIIKKSNKSKA